MIVIIGDQIFLYLFIISDNLLSNDCWTHILLHSVLTTDVLN